MTLFRQEVVEARRRRLWGEVRLSQSPDLKIWTGLVLLVSAIVLALLVVGRFTKKETVSGYVTPDRGIVEVRLPRAGRITDVLVKEGDTVEAGAVLMTVGSEVYSLERRALYADQVRQADEQANQAQARLTATLQGLQTEAERIRAQMRTQESILAVLQDQEARRQDAIQIARTDLDRLTGLAERGFAPQTELDRRRRALLAEEEALATLLARKAELVGQIEDGRGALTAIPARTAEARAAQASDSAGLLQRRAELDLGRAYSMPSPVSGVVAQVSARPGLAVTDGAVASIVPRGSTLQVRLLAPSRTIGFLQVGSPARIQVEAYPYQRFGFIEGRVRTISASVIQTSDARLPVAIDEPAYEVTVDIPRPWIEAYGRRAPLRPGMVVRADIALERKALWQLLFDPLIAAGRRNFT